MANAGRKPDASVPPGPDMDQRAYAAMLARAEALIPTLTARASRTRNCGACRRRPNAICISQACSGCCSRSA